MDMNKAHELLMLLIAIFESDDPASAILGTQLKSPPEAFEELLNHLDADIRLLGVQADDLVKMYTEEARENGLTSFESCVQLALALMAAFYDTYKTQQAITEWRQREQWLVRANLLNMVTIAILVWKIGHPSASPQPEVGQ